MKALILVLVCYCLSLQAVANNPLWIQKDKKIITAVVNLLNDKSKNPKEIEKYFSNQYKTISKDNLGFGWQLWEGRVGGGYISISGSFYYYHGQLVSYTLHPELPDEKFLQPSYFKWYSQAFPVVQQKLVSYYFNKSALQKPLLDSGLKLDTIKAKADIYSYMNPSSGIEYGYSGGYGNTVLRNREYFTWLKGTLTSDDIVLIMHSINPASRLTAIEYYESHKSEFKNQAAIEKWIEVIYHELPEVKSLMGCIGGKYDARSLVAKYSQIK